MSNFFERFKQQKNNKKTIPVILVVDSSGSMTGERILCVNKAIKTIFVEYANYNRSDAREFDIKVAVMQFASSAKWLTDGLLDPIEIDAPNISCGGVTNIGTAFNELNAKLSHNEFFSGINSYGAPLVFFISDGIPTDNYNFSLLKLKENDWYRKANKVAIAIGDDLDMEILSDVVGNRDAVIHLSSVMLLEPVMTGICTSLSGKSVSITSSNTQPVKPFAIPTAPQKNDFDSDRICYSTMASRRSEFDSDVFCATCALSDEPNDEFDSGKVTRTLSSWHNPDCGNNGSVVSDEAAERRKKLAESLRSGQPVTVTSNYETSKVQNNSSIPAIQVPDGKLAGGGIICGTCNKYIMPGFMFCPYCGAIVQDNGTQKVNVNQVQFSAVVPKRFIKGEYSMIDISVYEEMYRNIVDRIIANADNEVKEIVASTQEVTDKTKIRITLASPDIDIADCDETQEWHGKYLTFSFPVEVPIAYAKKQILFIATVYFNGFIATKLKFIANCTSLKEQKIQLTREDVLTAFISYASQDRGRVATIIQGMKKARPDMDIFFDVENLRSGEDWEKALRSEIERRDVLFLCWSNFAKQSEWVEKEWRYALANKGIDSIEPIPLVSPIECPPPEELKSKHFNDRALLYKDM